LTGRGSSSWFVTQNVRDVSWLRQHGICADVSMCDEVCGRLLEHSDSD
jgi:hypothetical protein